MPRIRPLREDEVPSEIQGYFRGALGVVLNSTGIYAYCPPIMEGARALGGAMEKSGRLPRQLRSLLNIKAASIVGCPF